MNRTVLLIVLALVTLDFAVLSGYAMMEQGYLGIWLYQFANPAGWQVLADLIIVSTLAMVWMVADARRSGRNAWPYVAITVFAGSFGPLLYLLVGLLHRPANRMVLA